MSHLQEATYIARELSGVIAEYRQMPCDSLQSRMFETLDRYKPRLKELSEIAEAADDRQMPGNGDDDELQRVQGELDAVSAFARSLARSYSTLAERAFDIDIFSGDDRIDLQATMGLVNLKVIGLQGFDPEEVAKGTRLLTRHHPDQDVSGGVHTFLMVHGWQIKSAHVGEQEIFTIHRESDGKWCRFGEKSNTSAPGLRYEYLEALLKEEALPIDWKLKKTVDEVTTITITRESDGAWCGGGLKEDDGENGLRFAFLESLLTSDSEA